MFGLFIFNDLKFVYSGVPLLILFVVGLGMRSSRLKVLWTKGAIAFATIIGCVSSFGLIMVGVYSMDDPVPHIYWSNFVFNLLFIAFFAIVLTLFSLKSFNKIVGIIGWIVVILIYLT